YFGRPFEIHDAQGGTQIPVCLRFEFELRRFTDAADLDVLILGKPDRDFGSRDVGNPCDKLEELVFDATKRFLLILDLLRFGLHFITFGRYVNFFLELSGDLVRGGVTELTEPLDLVNSSFSLTIQPLKRLYVQRKSPMSELLSGCVGVVAQMVDIQHSGNGSK